MGRKGCSRFRTTVGRCPVNTIVHGNSRQELRAFPKNTFDSCVTDPPYELGLMGKAWDKSGIAFDPTFWSRVLRVLKPGAHLMAFGGSRTFHRIAVAIEDAGFEMRDMIFWFYLQGMPKGKNVSKELDRLICGRIDPKQPISPQAQMWDGWNTGLAPCYEPVIMARKRLDGTVAQNTTKHGVGGINIGECSVGNQKVGGKVVRMKKGKNTLEFGFGSEFFQRERIGRWPGNILHDGSAEVTRHFDQYGHGGNSISRMFYAAKASTEDRDEGLVGVRPKKQSHELHGCKHGAKGLNSSGLAGAGASSGARNTHPTVKPVSLMRWLCRLVTPPLGVVLDPFMGSGSTGKAAVMEDMYFIGIEQDAESVEIARARVAARLKIHTYGKRMRGIL